MIFDALYIILLATLVIFALYYLAGSFHTHEKLHQGWVYSVKSGSVSPEVKRLFRKYLDKERFIMFWLQINRLKAIVPEGAFAELGVYRGDSARVLHALDPDRKLFLFDTFNGFEATDLEGEEGEALSYSTASFADTNKNLVKERIGRSEKVNFIEGNFKDTKYIVENEYFALVHIDADLAKPTAEALRFFYPRMLPGGVIIVHDYNPRWPGLMQAVDDFLETVPEEGIAIPDRDSSLLIIRNKTL